MISRTFILLFVAFVYVACNTDDDDPLTELNVNRQLWVSSQIESYKWSEIISCECGGPLQRDIFVVNSVKNRVDFDESLLYEGYTSEDVFNASKTVEEAFEFVQDLLNQNVASLSVEYDPTRGFPTIISIDYDTDFIDDEILYRYTNFETPLELN